MTNLTDRLVALLDAEDASYRLLHHAPTRTSEESARVRGTPLRQGAKALVFRADGTPILVVIPADRRVDSRAVKRALAIKDLRFISPDDLKELTGLDPGAVPPFGRLLGFPTYADEDLLGEPEISFNAGDRGVSVIMPADEYQRIERPVAGRFSLSPS